MKTSNNHNGLHFLLRNLVLFTVIILSIAFFMTACGDDDDDNDTEPWQPDYVLNFREAVRITCEAHYYCLSATQPGLFERDIKEMIDMVFDDEGAHGLAFDHIVASGENTLVGHYFGDDGELEDGEPLLIDIGAKYNDHCADVTRFFPVNGLFSARQKELYQLVIESLILVEETATPGVDSIASLRDLVAQYFQDSPLRANDENGNPRTMDYFFYYGLGHYIGSHVHGYDTDWSMYEPLEEWQVLALEPGLYIPSEQIGVRVEDDYVVTATGLENVSSHVPRTIQDIESWMSTARIIPHLKPHDSRKPRFIAPKVLHHIKFE